MKATKMSANGSFGSVQVTVPQNATSKLLSLMTRSWVSLLAWWVGFVSGVGADWVKRWLTRPKIIIDEPHDRGRFPLKNGRYVVYPKSQSFPSENLNTNTFDYTGTRIKVKNDGYISDRRLQGYFNYR